MSLATLSQVPENPADFQAWSFSNAASHRDIFRLIFQTLGIRLDEYVLDPFDPQDMGNWVNLHQVMHKAQNQALNLAGYDLAGIDWQVPQNVRWWILAHADEHRRASTALGLG